MIRIAVCEPANDTADALESIIAGLGGFVPEEIACETFASGRDFLEGLGRGDVYQLVCMNMDMGDMDGISLGRRLRETFSSRDTLLVYLSAFASFSEQMFDVQPFLFVRLPVEEKEFTLKLIRALEHIQQADDLFVCKKGRTVYQVRKSDIICLESAGRNMILSVAGKEDIQYRQAIKNEQEKFRTVNFLRPHSSYIVNLDYVEQYHTNSLVLHGGKIVPISELRMKEAKQAILRFWEYRNILK